MDSVLNRTGDPLIAPAQLSDLYDVARLQEPLEAAEGTGRDVPTLVSALCALRITGTGQALVAVRDGAVVGTLVMEFCFTMGDEAMEMPTVSGLACVPGAPRRTALLLMHAAAVELLRRGYRDVLIMTGTDHNTNRRTYRGIGFAPFAREGDTWALRANLETARAQIERRLRRK